MSEQTEGGTNLGSGVAAAKAAVDQLDTKDEVGVVTFDDGYTWQVPLEKVKDKDKIHQKHRDDQRRRWNDHQTGRAWH